MKNVFKIPSDAFAVMDFKGKGYMVEDDFFKTLLKYKIPYKQDEVKEYFKYEKMFSRLPEGRMNYEAFKKAFFSERFEEGGDIKKEVEFKLEKNLDEKSKSEILINRMMKVERLLKDRFCYYFVSIRKAFLCLDTDYDGFITAEDIARQFGKGDQKLDFRDLRTLVVNRDSKRIGKINYKDF
jgi:Ca2+-binding EF-hand superfamily protein